MNKDILIYGANGYTAELITELAVQEGSQPIQAGRTLHKIEPLASRHGLPYRIFGLEDPKVVAVNLKGVAVVLNCAGPFTRTARPLAEVCMQAGIHYLDITGEIEVFELLATFGGMAQQQGVMLMPGVGFDVVPSDCLARYVADQVPGATYLETALRGLAAMSSGTVKSALASFGEMTGGSVVRRDNRRVGRPRDADTLALAELHADFRPNSLRFHRPVRSIDPQALGQADLGLVAAALCEAARLQCGRDPRLI